ncbi:hypothetical protein PGT21_012895 [Puccinia graminis f. sp. tritici]|uniref:Uncharacterized protein n=1 Tax=Puccinia graminis f. sp. tritici TaxID=56615 RepID=A0A5B0MA46_PUCGR|nr:hypothetical protein PGT21_012895 [Puccinia graminis f. sp. tritici]
MDIDQSLGESFLVGFRNAGFGIPGDQLTRNPELQEHPTGSKNQLKNNPLNPSDREQENMLLQEHAGPSSSMGKAQIEPADAIKLRIKAIMDKEKFPEEKFKMELAHEKWMLHQIRAVCDKFARILHRLRVKIHHPLFSYAEIHARGLPLMITKVKDTDLRTTTFCWITNTDGNYVESRRLMKCFISLITFITYYHSNMLKKLHIEPGALQSRNQAITEWLCEEIVHPLIGFPIIGDITAEKMDLILAKKEPQFGKMNQFLSRFFSQPKIPPRTLSRVLINYWYFSGKTQMWKKYAKHQLDQEALKREIDRIISDTN